MSEFLSHAYHGLETLSESTSQSLNTNDLEVYLKLYLLLYADDTVIFAENKQEL